MKEIKKVRKPKPFRKFNVSYGADLYYEDIDNKRGQQLIWIDCPVLELKYAKKFQKWLTQAIAWLEQEQASK